MDETTVQVMGEEDRKGCNLFFGVNSKVIPKLLTGGSDAILRRGALITPSEQRLSLALRRARLIA
jgi:hypothetical protein